MSTIGITLNGEHKKVAAGASVADLLNSVGAESQNVAVVVNEHIVRPDARASELLQENDQVEILVFAGGG